MVYCYGRSASKTDGRERKRRLDVLNVLKRDLTVLFCVIIVFMLCCGNIQVLVAMTGLPDTPVALMQLLKSA